MIFTQQLINTLSSDYDMKGSRFRYLCSISDFFNRVMHGRAVKINDNERLSRRLEALSREVKAFEVETGIKIKLEVEK